MKIIVSAFVTVVLGMLSTQSFGARDTMSIVGSSTVFPFAKVVAERFGRQSPYKTPTVEATGTGGGIKEFCKAQSINTPDIVNASRRIKLTELAKCKQNGVDKIIEVMIGFDGLIFAYSRKQPEYDFTLRDIYLALARYVPDPGGAQRMVANPYRNWSDIRYGLPDYPIHVFGPPATSGSRDAFSELAMEAGCKTFEWIAQLKKTKPYEFNRNCATMREDGAYVDSVENDNLIVQKIKADPKTFGIFGYSYLNQNRESVQGVSIGGTKPKFDNIARGHYPISRSLFFYVNKDHINKVPGITEYMAEFLNERSWGYHGYLAEKGMIPLPKALQQEIIDRVLNKYEIIEL